MTTYNSFRPTRTHFAQLAEWHRQERAKKWGLPLDMTAVEIDQHITEVHRQQNVVTYGLPADADWEQIAKAARANIGARPVLRIVPKT